MLALAIEFSRCSKARTLKAEQCVLMTDPLRGPLVRPFEKGLLVAVDEGVSKE